MTGAIQTGTAPDQAPESPPPRRNARQEQQRRQTREALLRAAAAVFAERGYLDTSVEHVLARAGVSRAAFYAHFDSKLALVCEIARDFVPQWRPVFDQLMAEFSRATGIPHLTADAAVLISSPRMGIFFHVDPAETMLFHTKTSKPRLLSSAPSRDPAPTSSTSAAATPSG